MSIFTVRVLYYYSLFVVAVVLLKNVDAFHIISPLSAANHKNHVKQSLLLSTKNNNNNNNYNNNNNNDEKEYLLRGEEYSRCLTRKQQRDQILKEEKYSLYDQTPLWLRALWRPLRSTYSKIFPSKATKPGNLILIKCGESQLKHNFTFTGWLDPELTPQGVQECEHAARLLMEAGYEPDIIYTSSLKRAIHSVWAIVQELDASYLPVYKTWRLNERMYGALQGLNKTETAEQFGATVVQAWRRSMKARPPPAKPGDENDPSKDRRYAEIEGDIPLTESLNDCMDRTRPLWEHKISRDLRKGNNVVVVGHSNSIRGLVKIIDDVGEKNFEDIRFPPGIPFVYKFDRNLKPIPPPKGSLTQVSTSGEFLEKPGLLKEALHRQNEWKQNIPGTKDVELKTLRRRMSNMETSLLKLKQEKAMGKLKISNSTIATTTTGSTVSSTVINNNSVEEVKLVVEAKDDEFSSADEEFEEDTHRHDIKREQSSFSSMDDTNGNPNKAATTANVGQVDVMKDPVVVLIRHGTTPHNQLALFTGWEDPPLASQGLEDARRAGRLLKRHGFEFDVVYTSWLTRAIQTAWYVLVELDMEWLPIIKSWRLNERHYGALTGKSKKMVGNIYGQDQLIRWRRGFDIAPPPTSSYSFSYPGNDYKKTKYVKDIRISFTETFCRSIEARKLQIHRKFPKTESLKQCMDRSIPFYTEKIVPEAVSKGKRVLITSHENAIRGILMHLCEIPEECMNELHLPNGLPLIYNVRRKCISLLDDGSGKDPMETYDFGSAAEYLFRPCELLEEDFDVKEDSTRSTSSSSTTTTTTTSAATAATTAAAVESFYQKELVP